jgi:hypothetical protein
MESYNELINTARILLGRNEILEDKYTKAESLRIRKEINLIQKLAIQAKKDLIEKDNRQ